MLFFSLTYFQKTDWLCVFKIAVRHATCDDNLECRRIWHPQSVTPHSWL